MSQFTITVEGIDALKEKLDGVIEPIMGIVKDAGDFAQQKTAEYARPHAADTGALGQKITLKLTAEATVMEATIAPNDQIMGLAVTVEEGRAPGNAPPADAIGGWAERHGYLPGGISKKLRWLLGRQLALKIAAGGTVGVHMFQRAAVETETKVRELVDQAAREIKSRWGD